MSFSGTRFAALFKEFIGNFKREIKIYLTPVPKDKKWVFLVGCYNSGTTLLSEVLGKHPEISALATEGHFITDQFIKDYDIGLPRMWVDREDIFCLTEDDVGPDARRIKKEWGMRLDLSKKVLLEKSPPNSSKTRWLQKNFEEAYFIGIVRNGYAVAEGISRKANPKHLRNGWPIEKCAYQWARSNEVLQKDSKQLKRFIWVSYEDLTDNTSDTLDTITEFLGINRFEVRNANKIWQIHEREEKIRNMNNESISRLDNEKISKINEVAGRTLDRFNYKRIKQTN